MIYIVAGIILGVLAGLNLNVTFSPEHAVYISLAVLAIVNTIFNMLNENIKGELTFFKSLISLAGDMIFGLLLGYIGEQLGLPIYLAAVFAFGNNIYKNIGDFSRYLLEKYNKNR